jgi:8-oxo-dGTP pyrophosphatase MutT (NUDIX family)
MEEAGLRLGALHEVAEVYCSPGNSSEFYYLYVGDADLPDDSAGIGGLDAEDEDIRSHILDFDAFMEMCDRFALANAPLLILAFWLARHRDRLRAAAGF